MSAPVQIVDVAVLSDQWYVPKRYSFDHLR